MSLLHMLWLPFAYKFAPVWLGQHSLRGFMKVRGIDLLGFPLQVSRALAEDTYKIHSFEVRMRHLGLLAAMADYTKSLELTAAQVCALLHEPDRSNSFLALAVRQKDIMESFGLTVPPINVDR